MSITIRPKNDKDFLCLLCNGTFIEWNKKVHMVIDQCPRFTGGQIPYTTIRQIDIGVERQLYNMTPVRVVHLVDAIFE